MKTNDLHSIYEPLDEGIKELVLTLRDNGFNTITSCQGGGWQLNHEFDMPTVRIESKSRQTMTLQRKRIVRLLSAKGYQEYYIKEVFAYSDTTDSMFPHYLEIEFWLYPLMEITT